MLYRSFKPVQVKTVRQFSISSKILQLKENDANKSTSTTTESKVNENEATESNKLKYEPFSKAQTAFLERLIRVDQAGELGANYIYAGQYFVLASRYPHLKPILRHMWDQEIYHHSTFNKLQIERRVRPSLLTPLWKLGALGLGIGTGLLGKEAAMACTVAVETVIGGHYNEQLRVLMNQYNIPAVNSNGDFIENPESSPEMTELKKLVSSFRDDELEHLDTAIENDAEKAVPYMLLTEAIKIVCRGAIWTAERI